MIGFPWGFYLFTAARRREDILFRLSSQLEKAVPWSNHK
ncbi:hypothetical protein LEP1GSC084_3482 [Leptospira interrogans serovar Medanensis str. L0448]|nr:hypothetical protein LEP1GSC099_0963 [Leptospira interrogans str. UI 08452]EMN37683.1 hypothetical protein LEP1GSC084_3482 [Leptospira interrogans serovar Medanensis str. L0448]EMN37950.1 hypothetical protein LEP1GSC085_2714 [Leptospira interrogans str. L0996]EMN96290.1 hypothetical protein LEP1GSC110_2496 [Leptospira interrogans serovar Medanensis str. UT053]